MQRLPLTGRRKAEGCDAWFPMDGNLMEHGNFVFSKVWTTMTCGLGVVVLFCSVLFCFALLALPCFVLFLSHTIPLAIGAYLHLSSSLSYVLSLLVARPHFFFLNSARMKRDRDFSWLPTNSASRPRLTSMNCSANRSGIFEFESCSHCGCDYYHVLRFPMRVGIFWGIGWGGRWWWQLGWPAEHVGSQE